MLRIEPHKEDQAPSAILELVDGPRDMRFAMTARTLAWQRARDTQRETRGEPALGVNDITVQNVHKVTRFRAGGEQALESLVRRFEQMGVGRDKAGAEGGAAAMADPLPMPRQKRVYPKKE